MLLHWSDSPNNFWWLSRSPIYVFIFQENLSGPPLILPKFSAIPHFAFSVTTDPPFCSPKIKWSPLNPPPPNPQAIKMTGPLGSISAPLSVLVEQRLKEPAFLSVRFSPGMSQGSLLGPTISEMTYENSKEISVPIVDYCQQGSPRTVKRKWSL